MAVNSVSPGSYNSPSVQPQAQTQRAPEKVREEKTPPPESKPTVNTSGQTVGTLVNIKA
jgi:hypothetical protein